MAIPLLDLKLQYASIKDEALRVTAEIYESQMFILGRRVDDFERDFAAYCQTRHAIAVSSGTDALLEALMVLGIGQGENFFASDVSAIVAHTRDAVYLKDFDIAAADRDKFEITSLLGGASGYEVSKVEFTEEDVSKGEYPHYMLKEIYEQPATILDAMRGRLSREEATAKLGGLGMTPGANIGDTAAIFEAVHGSAPDIAGKGVANPLALILASAMMLSHVGRHELAGRLRQAIDRTLNQDSIRTRDLGGSASTREFADALIRHIS